MSAVSTAPPPVRVPAERARVLAWLSGGLMLVALLVTLALIAWPESNVDKARDDGQQFGTAALHLYDAQSPAEADDALAEMDAVLSDTRDHAGDAVAQQVTDQQDALERAVDGFVGTNSTDDAFEADLYQAELDGAVDDLTTNASDFRAEGPDVQQAFWDGFDDGFQGD